MQRLYQMEMTKKITSTSRSLCTAGKKVASQLRNTHGTSVVTITSPLKSPRQSSMGEMELLEHRIDNVHTVLEREMGDWAKNYWSTTLFALVRKLNDFQKKQTWH